MTSRLHLLVRRFFKAQQCGLWFTGTSRFHCPTTFRLGTQTFSYRSPEEPSNSYDFINLVFDDEYGLRTLPHPPRTVLDIGSNCGLFSLLANHHFPTAIIHAFEPNPRTFPFAQENLRSTSVQLTQAGIGSSAGQAEIIDRSDSTFAQTRLVESGSIRILPLTEVVAAFPGGEVDLLKLDCEGAEWEIFQNPAPFSKINRIHMEYHLTEGRTLDHLRQTLENLGYVFEKLVENQGFGIAWVSRKPS